jgi:PHD/YefM family antitoxin component YafN of YafNO toxin-antitoxin module
MKQLTANDIKVKGVSAIEAALQGHAEATITVRGKDKYVVMDVAQYNYLRECEIEAALAQTQADYASGRFVKESADEHIAKLDALLAHTQAKQ